jgi:hypothetical protein
VGKKVLASHRVGNHSYLSHNQYYIIQQPAEAGSKRYVKSTDRDTEDHYLYVIQLAVFQLSANDTRWLISHDISLLVPYFSLMYKLVSETVINSLIL